MREHRVEKLRPDRFTSMSGWMAAIVGYILDKRFSEPAISELVVTPTASSWSTPARALDTPALGRVAHLRIGRASTP